MGVKDTFIAAERMKELDITFKKELEECSEKGIEISQECKEYYKKKFESEKNDDETEKNSERS